MKQGFRMGMLILCVVIALMSFRRGDTVIAVASIVFAILFLMRLLADRKTT